MRVRRVEVIWQKKLRLAKLNSSNFLSLIAEMYEEAPEIRCSQSNDAIFYTRMARQFLLGIRNREGEMVKKPVDVIKITGLGSTANQCVSVVGRITSQNIAKVVNVNTGFMPLKDAAQEYSNRGVAQLTIVLQVLPDARERLASRRPPSHGSSDEEHQSDLD